MWFAAAVAETDEAMEADTEPKESEAKTGEVSFYFCNSES